MRWLALLPLFALASCFGSPVPQAVECDAWVRCQRAVDARAGLPVANLERFEAGGFCWNNAELARGCTTACERALERLRARATPLPGECSP